MVMKKELALVASTAILKEQLTGSGTVYASADLKEPSWDYPKVVNLVHVRDCELDVVMERR